MSPKIVTFSPAIFPLRSRMVKVSSNAWVGCSCAPSPALTTWALSTRARKCGAPEALWRMTMKSALSASRLRAVSLSVSPFLSEDASAVKLMMSADRRCSESSKLMRVRVEGSMKRLTTVLPRSAGTFLIARSPTALNARAVSSTVTISSALSDSMSSRCLRFQLMSFSQDDLVRLAGKVQPHAHFFRDGGRHVLADKIRAHRQLAVAPVDEHGQLDALGPAEI